MRSFVILALVVGAAASVCGADPKPTSQPSVRVSPLVRPPPELQLKATNMVYRSQKYPNVEYSGALVQMVKYDKPWQVVNPLAPARYGSAELNTLRHPETKRPEGIKLFSIGF